MRVEFASSTLLDSIEYNEQTQDLTVYFKKYYTDKLTYEGVPYEWVAEMLQANSAGRFYLNYIKSKCKLKTMAEQNKTEYIPIKLKINVKMLNKDWFFEGEKGVYAAMTLMYRADGKADEYGNCGMITQDVPKEIWEEERDAKVPKNQQTKGNILGNGRVFKSKREVLPEEIPGQEGGKLGVSDAVMDDLPF